MRTIGLILIFIITSGALFTAEAQVVNKWYSYHDAKKDLYGFKDAKGNIQIRARYNGFTRASIFRNIVAVRDDSTNKSYYLLKSGRKAGIDSIYVWDMTYDCEQEGAIRFRDPVTDRVGFLGTDGKVLIKAAYNDAQPFYNGLALVIHDGKRICADGTPYKAGCEHWSWDGKTALINIKGDMVADNIDVMATRNLNWYSCEVASNPADTALRTSFKAKNSKYYTFINYQREFDAWFNHQFLPAVQSGSLADNCFKEITVEGPWKQTLRKKYNKVLFLKQYTTLLQKKMAAIQQHKVEVFTVSEALNPYIYNNKTFQHFYTDCGDANEARFPSFEVIANYNNANQQLSFQEHFSFLRTDNGYKLIGVMFKK